MEFLVSHEILYGNQFGFRKGNSTIHSLIQITEQIKNSIEKGKIGCGVFVDLKKPFNTVNHDILWKNLTIMVSEVAFQLGFVPT